MLNVEPLEAAQHCRADFPDSYPCAELKGEVERSRNYFRQAIESLSYALRLRPGSPQAQFGLATSLAGIGKIPEASAALEATLKADPKMASAYIEYAKLLIRVDNPLRASSDAKTLGLVNKGLEMNPQNGEAHYLLGYLRFERGKYDDALPSLLKAAQLTPQDSQVHYLLSRFYGKLGKAEQAAQELRVYQKLSVKPHEGKPE